MSKVKVSSKMQKAIDTGLRICERFSKATLKYIGFWDPDLHFDIMKARKKKGIKDK